jgi:hypothetical protein
MAIGSVKPAQSRNLDSLGGVTGDPKTITSPGQQKTASAEQQGGTTGQTSQMKPLPQGVGTKCNCEA